MPSAATPEASRSAQASARTGKISPSRIVCRCRSSRADSRTRERRRLAVGLRLCARPTEDLATMLANVSIKCRFGLHGFYSRGCTILEQPFVALGIAVRILDHSEGLFYPILQSIVVLGQQAISVQASRLPKLFSRGCHLGWICSCSILYTFGNRGMWQGNTVPG